MHRYPASILGYKVDGVNKKLELYPLHEGKVCLI
jgi:hypothetical protein